MIPEWDGNGILPPIFPVGGCRRAFPYAAPKEGPFGA